MADSPMQPTSANGDAFASAEPISADLLDEMAGEGPNPLGLLQRFVGTPSSYPDETQFVEVVAHTLESYGFKVTRHDVVTGRANLLAEKGPPDKPAILFTGHLDTVQVPAGYTERNINPLDLRYDTEAGAYRGLGAADMKGGLAAIVAGLAPVEPKNSRLKIAFTVDEENISLGVNRLFRDHAAWFKDVRVIISADTGTVPFESRHRFPPVMFITGRLGRFTIKANVRGPRGHGAYSDPSRNAVMEAARFLVALDKARDQLGGRHDFLGRSDLSVQTVVGTAEGYSSPGNCQILLHWMALPDEMPESVIQRLQSFTANAYAAGTLRNANMPIEFSLPFRETPFATGYSTPRFGPMLDLVAGVYGDVLGHAPRYTMGRSVSDDNFFAERLPDVPLFNLGPKGGDVHTATEWLDAEALPTATKLYREVARVFDGIGIFKPFWDALSADEQKFISAVARQKPCRWIDIQDALTSTTLNPRRVADKIGAVIDQFFPPTTAPGMVTRGEEIILRDDLRTAMQAGLDYLDSKGTDPVPLEPSIKYTQSMPVFTLNTPVEMPSGFGDSGDDTDVRILEPESAPSMPPAEPNPLPAHPDDFDVPTLEGETAPVPISDVELEAASSASESSRGQMAVKSGRSSTVRRAPSAPPDSDTNDVVRIDLQDVADANASSGSGDSARRVSKAPPPPPEGDDGAVRISRMIPRADLGLPLPSQPPPAPADEDSEGNSERRRAPKLPPGQ